MQKIKNCVSVDTVHTHTHTHTHTQVFRKLIKKYINIIRQVNL